MKKNLFVQLFLFCLIINLSAQDNLFDDGKAYYDTYHHVAAIEDSALWNLYNVHDPSVYKDGDYYYMYSTDASWGGVAGNGAQKRRSKDLVNWEYLGTAFDGVPESAQTYFKTHGNPDYEDSGVWAPFLYKLRDKYILYYSAPGGIDGTTFAYIGYATSNSANGPWEDQGVVTTAGFYDESTETVSSDTINAIDPTVIFDNQTRKLWMAYGSWHTGIYILELDTVTGGIKTEGDRGTKIANRYSSAYGQEGPELTYHNGYYYLFESYDALGDLYNVRVGRATSPDGPYYDFFGDELTNKADNYPMILAPYAFNDNYGWQGTGHCGVYNDDGQYYMFQQGRPTVEASMMVGQVRKIFWINDCPVLSPERYAGVSQSATIDVDDFVGDWENIDLEYKTTSNFLSTSDSLTFISGGSFNGDNSGIWSLSNDTLLMTKDNVEYKCVVYYGWDWEYDCKTLLYSGISDNGICVWGKKVYEDTIQSINTIVDGATYTIRSAYSHLMVQPADSVDGISYIETAEEASSNKQLWTARDAGGGYYYLLPRSGDQELALAVQDTSEANNARYLVEDVTGSEAEKFKISYQKNGYYALLSWASYAEKGFDLWGYNCDAGAEINQYTFSEDGWHQHWRFERVDTVPIDLSADLEANTTDREKVTASDLPTITEPFDYTGNYLEGENGGNGWGSAWTISGETSNIALVDGLIYTNLETSGKSLQITSVDDSGTEAIRTLTETYPVDGNTYWISFLCKIENPNTVDNSWQGISLNMDDTEELFLGKLWGQSYMGINDPDVYANYTTDYAYTEGLAWYVFCINTETSKAYMWINPNPDVKPETADADLSTDADINDGFNKIRIHLGQTAGITMNIDEFRLGESYSSITTSVEKTPCFTEDNVTLYPNPTKGDNVTLNLSALSGQNLIISVLTLSGKKINCYTVYNQNEYTLPTNMDAGLYLVNIQGDNVNITKKLLVY